MPLLLFCQVGGVFFATTSNIKRVVQKVTAKAERRHIIVCG